MTVMGNSFAAPQIAGLAARILGKHPGLTPWQVKTVLRAVSRNIRDAHAAPAADQREAAG